jgi:molecular chaperone DnaK (HSP70)
MLAKADKYATADKEKRQNIDLKKIWSIMLWSWKELGLFKDNISEDQQQNITKIIEDIRQEIQNDDFELKLNKLKI